MKINTLIKRLQAISKKEGNISVGSSDGSRDEGYVYDFLDAQVVAANNNKKCVDLISWLDTPLTDEVCVEDEDEDCGE